MKRLLPLAALIVASTGAAIVFLAQSAPATAPADLPPSEAAARARLNASPRHGEFVTVKVPGIDTPIKCYIVHPSRADKAPVVIVTMEIYGLSDWLMATTDQLAADGFIAIAPYYLSGKGPNGGGTEAFADRTAVTRAVSGLDTALVISVNNAVADYATKLPNATDKFANVGFCWGGGKSFAYAAAQPKLAAAVVYYGMPPADPDLAKITCPVLAFYPTLDNRTTATEKPTEDKMKALGKTFTGKIEQGATHGFLRAQTTPADIQATKEAWPLTIQLLKDSMK